MKIFRSNSIVLALIASLNSFCLELAFSEPERRWPREDEIQLGSTTSRVASVWGEPSDRVQKELLQEEVWDYRGLKIYFKNGLVVSVGDKQPAVDIAAASAEASIEPVLKKLPVKTKVLKPGNLAEILQDISKASSSGPSNNGGVMPGYDPSMPPNNFPVNNNGQVPPPPLPFNFPTPQMGQPFGFNNE